MNLTRTVAIGVAGGALITWLSWAATPAPRSMRASPTSPRALDRDSGELAREIARLHEHLRPAVEPEYARNVFAFPSRSAEPPSVAGAAGPAATTRPAIAPRAPVLTLEGMAEDAVDAAIVRTAIIASAGRVYLAREGDAVTARYRVVRLSADAAELRDVDTGDTLRLVLP